VTTTSYQSVDRATRRRRLADAGGPPNGIDYVEIVDGRGLDDVFRQRLLRVFFVHDLTEDISGGRITIDGGDRIEAVGVRWAVSWKLIRRFRSLAKDESWTGSLAPSEEVLDAWWLEQGGAGDRSDAFDERWSPVIASEAFARLVLDDEDEVRKLVGVSDEDADQLLVVHTDSTGDYSNYRLAIESGIGTDGKPTLDPVLDSVDVFFKVDCDTSADCKAGGRQLEDIFADPEIDYLARDYASFRRLMLDRLSQTVPDWTDRNPADIGMTLVEVMAYAADQLAYLQDAVGTEAYLGTARKRASVRRHARLVDYYMHEGHNARAFVHVGVSEGAPQAWLRPGGPLAEGAKDRKNVRFLTQCPGEATSIEKDGFEVVFDRHRPDVFELLEPAFLTNLHNKRHIHDWGDPNYTLPEGATSVAIVVAKKDYEMDAMFRVGDLVVFEQTRDPELGEGVADPKKRHVVRLTRVSAPASLDESGDTPERKAPTMDAYDEDPVESVKYVELSWSEEDALPFDLPVSRMVDGDELGQLAVVRGNIALADHGRTVFGDERALEITRRDPLRATLAHADVTHTTASPGKDGSARDALQTDPRDALPALVLDGDAVRWDPVFDLLNSDSLDEVFVAEPDSARRMTLRFGDGTNGRPPARPDELDAVYRVGNGARGNLPAESLVHVVGAPDEVAEHIESVSNPLSAQGGHDPEPVDQVRHLAPKAFRTQERAVTLEDYARMAKRHPQVQRAVATRRWTGSWWTTYLTVDRVGGRPVDRAFESEIVRFLEQFRLAGDDLEIERPDDVAVDIRMTVCVASGYDRSDVHRALKRRFSNEVFADGSRGFFHPDNFTFGEPLYVSDVIAAAMGVAGVSWVDLDPNAEGRQNRFKPRHGDEYAPYEAGKIEVSRRELIRLENDPNHRELGTIEFDFEGGR
jgi:hypothetical protein